MKKYIALILAFLLMAQLCACGRPAQPEMPTGMGQDSGLTDADIYGTWYASPEMGSAQVTINRDGTCLYYDQIVSWTVWEEYENRISIGSDTGFEAHITGYAYGTPVLYCNDFGVMLRSAQLWQYRGFWETDFGQHGYIDEYTIQFSSDEFARIQISEDGDSVICIITESNGTQIQLMMHHTDGYPVIEYADNTGAMELYYNADNRPPVDTKEVLYRDAVQKLEMVLNGGYIRYEDNSNMVTSGCNAYAYIYRLFEQLGDYKDSKQYLANFKVIEDVFVDVREPGEEFNTALLYIYGEHDDQGRRLTGKVINMLDMATELGFYACGDFYQLTYGEDGLVSQILTHDGDEREPVAIGIPSYDTQGNMISLDVTWHNELSGTITYTSRFTYDDQGRRLTYEIPNPNAQVYYYGQYYYDSNGKLLQLIVDKMTFSEDTPKSRSITEYVYDDNGVLTEQRWHNLSPSFPTDWGFNIKKYSNDSSDKAQSLAKSQGMVYRCLDDAGNQGALNRRYLGQYSEEDYVFDEVIDWVFDRHPDDVLILLEHDYVIDTTQMALEWGNYDQESKTHEEAVWYEEAFIYTDVYLYCPEN